MEVLITILLQKVWHQMHWLPRPRKDINKICPISFKSWTTANLAMWLTAFTTTSWKSIWIICTCLRSSCRHGLQINKSRLILNRSSISEFWRRSAKKTKKLCAVKTGSIIKRLNNVLKILKDSVESTGLKIFSRKRWRLQTRNWYFNFVNLLKKHFTNLRSLRASTEH